MTFLLSVVLLVAGAVLKFTNPPFFQQAHQVGGILMIAGAALIALIIVLSIYSRIKYNQFKKEHIDSRSFFGPFGRL